jgi:Uma2 family endonuclease
MNLAFSEDAMPVRIIFEQPLSDEALMRFSAENEWLRVERDANGELIVMSPSGSEGSGWNAEITADLTIWARGDGRGRVFDSNGGFTLPDCSVRAADAAWVSFHRWNALTREQQQGYAPICPEFVIELKSPSDRLPELQAKMEMWIANGAEVAWLIDPQRKTVEIYRPGDSPEELHDPSSVQGTGPMGGFELVMTRVWQ